MPIRLSDILVDIKEVQDREFYTSDEQYEEAELNRICSLCKLRLELNGRYEPIEHTLDLCLKNMIEEQ